MHIYKKYHKFKTESINPNYKPKSFKIKSINSPNSNHSPEISNLNKNSLKEHKMTSSWSKISRKDHSLLFSPIPSTITQPMQLNSIKSSFLLHPR